MRSCLTFSPLVALQATTLAAPPGETSTKQESSSSTSLPNGIESVHFSTVVQLEFRPQSSHELPLARQVGPQKASGNGSLPGASLRCWPAPAIDEPRLRSEEHTSELQSRLHL